MYFPASQIKTNLYTNGGEFIKKDSKENYIGFYWKTSSNKFYTGKTPDDIVIDELEQNLTPTDDNLNSDAYTYVNQNSLLARDYFKLNNSFSKPLILPKSSSPKPNSDDYEIGEFTRFFTKKTNELIYIEINENTYNKLISQDPTYLYHLYFPFKYSWKLTGTKDDVYFTNKKVTNYMIDTFKLSMFDKFLKEDYLKFYI